MELLVEKTKERCPVNFWILSRGQENKIPGFRAIHFTHHGAGGIKVSVSAKNRNIHNILVVKKKKKESPNLMLEILMEYSGTNYSSIICNI